MNTKRTILDELFDGNIQPFENIKVEDTGYKQTSKKIDDEKESWLYKLLSNDDTERYEKLESMYQQTSVMEEREAFKQGFRLGVLLVTEAFYTKDRLVEKEN